MKNILDMLRYFLPTPPVPVRWRRRLLAVRLGRSDAGDLLVADRRRRSGGSAIRSCRRSPGSSAPTRWRGRQRSEILHIRHHSLYAPRDFDLSPYFHVVKPTLE